MSWPKGKHRSLEEKEKISRGVKAIMTPELIERIASKLRGRKRETPWLVGRKISDEHKRKFCFCWKGKEFSESHRRNLSLNHADMNGENNPNWKGGKTPLYLQNRQTNACKIFRQEVLKRDGFKCVDCGAGNKLQVHHLKRYENNLALRFDVDNGVTLCPGCHIKRERLS